MASEATEEKAVVLGDKFVVEEILARLPVCAAVRCTVLSKRFHHLLTSSDFWLRHRRAPLELLLHVVPPMPHTEPSPSTLSTPPSS
ncbi:hypothetical protein QYE76_019545 [Lolium multiflorum]|uniref:F-box domain-containing protein n=1 Tax=Lolium multiflorum TaxID=4521 RepID=A0AAD8VRC1_LOLMU|nr:hypothetical protein QYE76_019545 [Lolium multiflorum]